MSTAGSETAAVTGGGSPGSGAQGTTDAMPAAKLGMYLFLAADAMFFVGLLGSFVVLGSAGGEHEVFVRSAGMLNRWVGLLSMLLLLVSSLTIWLGRWSGRWFAISGAGGFLLLEMLQWKLLLPGVGPWTNNFFGCYFLFTAVLGLQLLCGMIWLFVIPLTPVSEVHPRAGSDVQEPGSSEYLRDRRQRKTGLSDCVQIYWHFVNAVGVFGLFVLYFV